MQILESISDLLSWRQNVASAGHSVGFVPTMGALHAGHLSLLNASQQQTAQTIASIFVNPLQFGPSEDLAKYPRPLARDKELLAQAGVDALFLPTPEILYPDGFQTLVTNSKISRDLCGAQRPGHFDGVLTVVLKLFHLVDPQVAVFGKKDYQQWRLIDGMVRDLNLSISIVGGSIVRETNGLAMSSRNQYLSSSERERAAILYKSLQAAAKAFNAGERRQGILKKECRDILDDAGELTLEYLEIREGKDLAELPETITQSAVLLAAIRFAGLRLIDNIELKLERA